jgi:hypothetical protein
MLRYEVAEREAGNQSSREDQPREPIAKAKLVGRDIVSQQACLGEALKQPEQSAILETQPNNE